MSKISEYLNEHLHGEVTTSGRLRNSFSRDASALSIKPELVVYPKDTSDLRKIARFVWQLSEKGHKLPITMRGLGSDQTGAAIGEGVLVNTTAHMDEIFEVDEKQKLVRVQPGVSLRTLNQALRLKGLRIPSFPSSHSFATVGGAIANNASGIYSGKYGSTMGWVKQLEIVLSNGEILQTGRLNRKDLSKKRLLQTFEGEVYRNIDNLIHENDQLIDSLAIQARDNVGYNIVDVKNRDGSLDMTPLFVGSQGTLGLISEVIMMAEQIPDDSLVGAIAFTDYESAIDGIDVLRSLNPASLEYIDGRILDRSSENGNKYPFYLEALESGTVAAVLVFEFDDPKGYKRKVAKKIAKEFKDTTAYVVLKDGGVEADELRQLQVIPALAVTPDTGELDDSGLLKGAYIPPERLDDFFKSVRALEKKEKLLLPIYGHASQHVYSVQLLLDPTRATERHKLLKALADWAELVDSHGGHLIGEAAEGRLKAPFAYKSVESDVMDIFASIRDIFDPMGILNTGVKQDISLKQVVAKIRTDYNTDDHPGYIEKL